MKPETMAVGTLVALLLLGLLHLALILWAGYQALKLRLLYLATKAQTDHLTELTQVLVANTPLAPCNPKSPTPPSTSTPTPSGPSAPRN